MIFCRQEGKKIAICDIGEAQRDPCSHQSHVDWSWLVQQGSLVIRSL